MTLQADPSGILDLLTCPGFCVKDNLITYVNQAASGLLLIPGTDVRSLLLTGSEEYADFQEGCLYLTLNLSASGMGASVIRREDGDYFLLDQEPQDEALRALALAARELRGTLTGAMVASDLLSRQPDPKNTRQQEQLAILNRSLNRTLRVIGNMSDAENWPSRNRQEIREIRSVLQEIFEKAQTLTAASGVRLEYTGLQEDVYTLLDLDQLERAVFNILSNSLKFSSDGAVIRASLTRRGKTLRLTIQDSGPGIPDAIRSTLFRRYQRQCAIEDSRFGLGLGMVLIRSAASAHGGTVLVDQPEQGGTRVTLTFAIRQDSGATFRSPLLQPDYAGERDHGLLELADCLPASLYQK